MHQLDRDDQHRSRAHREQIYLDFRVVQFDEHGVNAMLLLSHRTTNRLRLKNVLEEITRFV